MVEQGGGEGGEFFYFARSRSGATTPCELCPDLSTAQGEFDDAGFAGGRIDGGQGEDEALDVGE